MRILTEEINTKGSARDGRNVESILVSRSHHAITLKEINKASSDVMDRELATGVTTSPCYYITFHESDARCKSDSESLFQQFP